MNVYQKLNEARAKFHSLKLVKSGRNTFAKYSYFELGDFLIPALGVFREVGLCAVVSFDTDKACMIIRDVDKPDDWITIYSPMGSADLKGCHVVQNIGAVETYQRRYLWVAAMEIVEHDALDSSEPIKPAKQKVGVMADVLAGLPPLSPEDESYFAELAENLEDLLLSKGAAVAYDRVHAEGLDSEQTLWLWSKLGSKLRAALKTEKASRVGTVAA